MTPEPTQQDAVNCAVKKVIVPGALNIMSARGTEHLKVPWAHWTIVATRTSVWIRSGQMNLFVFLAMVPTPDRSWGFPIYFFKYCHLRLPH